MNMETVYVSYIRKREAWMVVDLSVAYIVEGK